MAGHTVGGRKKVFAALEAARNAPKIMTGYVFVETYLLIRNKNANIIVYIVCFLCLGS